MAKKSSSRARKKAAPNRSMINDEDYKLFEKMFKPKTVKFTVEEIKTLASNFTLFSKLMLRLSEKDHETVLALLTYQMYDAVPQDIQEMSLDYLARLVEGTNPPDDLTLRKLEECSRRFLMSDDPISDIEELHSDIENPSINTKNGSEFSTFGQALDYAIIDNDLTISETSKLSNIKLKRLKEIINDQSDPTQDELEILEDVLKSTFKPI